LDWELEFRYPRSANFGGAQGVSRQKVWACVDGYFRRAKGGEATSHVREASEGKCEICVAHQPDPPDLSHSGVFGYTFTDDDDVIADLIAEKVLETFPAKI
jgi:hypothetical protein